MDSVDLRGAIELLPHPALSRPAPLEHLGWDPAEVNLLDLGMNFDSRELLHHCRQNVQLHYPNNRKYTLSRMIWRPGNPLGLELKHTDWFTLRQVQAQLVVDQALRREYANIDPQLSRVPGSLCLHYIVRFAGGELLCMRRSRGLASHPGRWSFSGEEQFDLADLEKPRPVEALFQRAMLEEVLPLARSNLSEMASWKAAAEIIHSMRLWSVFVETAIWNFTLFGVFQLQVNAASFELYYRSLSDYHFGKRDLEGEMFVATVGELRNLFTAGRCQVRGLFDEEPTELLADDLHPTSAYRLMRLLKAVKAESTLRR